MSLANKYPSKKNLKEMRNKMTLQEMIDLRVQLAINASNARKNRVYVEPFIEKPMEEEEWFMCSHGHDNCFNH
jgi:hypothetical protein